MKRHKILAIKLRSLGDTVILTASLQELIRAFPQSEIHMLVTETWTPLLEGFPGIHRIWRAPLSWKKLTFFRRLRAERFDSVINFHASPSSARLARLTGAPIRSIHFHGHQDSNRYSTVEIPGKGVLKPAIERDMDAVRALGVHIPAGKTPKIYLQPGEIQAAQNYLQSMDIPFPILGLALGASRATKAWPLERMSALALDWCERSTGSVIAFAGPHEGHLIQQFLKQVDEILPLQSLYRKRIRTLPPFELRPLAALISQLSVLVGNDSGPKHVAVAVDTPTLTLFGPEHPFEWHPYATDRHPFLFIEPLTCRKSAAPGMPPWCGLEECIVEEHRCMRGIGVNAVLERALDLACAKPSVQGSKK